MIAAAILGRAGKRVALIEREPRLGGRVRSFEPADGFVVDAGAYLWPDAYVSEALRRAGATGFVASEIPRQQVLRLFAEGEGGRRLAFPYPMRRPSERLLASAEVALGVDASGYDSLTALWAKLAALPDDDVESLRHVPLAEGLRRLGADGPVAGALKRNVMLYGTYDPDSASTADCIELCRRPLDRPVAVPVVAGANPGGGVAALVRSLGKALVDAGVEVTTGERVHEIRIESGRVVGVRCGAEQIAARNVVCNVPIWSAIDLVAADTFPAEFVDQARAWSVVGGVIASAYGFRGMPSLRATGEPDDFPGWTRLLTGSEHGFGGGMVWTTLHSPANAPPGFHILQAMRLSPRRDVDDAERVATVHAAFDRMVREIYLDADERMVWAKQWTTPDSSEYMISAARRPPVVAAGIDGLFFVGETTDVPAVQMDAAALSAMRCAVALGAAS